jgi:hypothetical protein
MKNLIKALLPIVGFAQSGTTGEITTRHIRRFTFKWKN